MEREDQWKEAKELAAKVRGELIYNDERKTWLQKDHLRTPQWMIDIFHSCHVMPECQDAVFPNDHVYKAIVLGLDLFDKAEDEEAWDEGYQNIEADIYNTDLLAWVGSNLEFTAFADQVMQELQPTEFFSMLQMAQVAFRQHVIYVLKEALLEQVEKNEEVTDGNV